MATISKGITLSYKADGTNDYTELHDLMEISELGGDSESIEITTLESVAHTYTDGLLNYGDNLPFKFLYKKEQFTTLQGVKKANWMVKLPDGATCSFDATASVKLEGVGTNAVLTYLLNLKPQSEMIWA